MDDKTSREIEKLFHEHMLEVYGYAGDLSGEERVFRCAREQYEAARTAFFAAYLAGLEARHVR